MIARLLQIANTYPPSESKHRERFYAMKQRILHRFGKVDDVPFDIQFIPGKKCFRCDGTGQEEEYCGDYDNHYTCDRCGGNGWWKDPVWVTLRRWRIGGRVFHEPVSRSRIAPELNPNIVGYVTHEKLPFKDVKLARLVLALLFDWRLLWMETDHWWVRKVVFRKRRLLKWRPAKTAVEQCQDNEMPF